MRRTVLLCLAVVVVLSGGGPARSGASTAAPEPRSDTSDGADPGRRPAVAPPVARSGSDAGAPEGEDAARMPPPVVAPPALLPDRASPGGAGDRLVDSALTSAEGFLIAPGGAISGTGPRWRYTVELEPATGLDLDVVADTVARALHDPRSWAATRTLEQVDDPRSARIRLLIATPATVDRLCAEVGLRTVGIYSCWNGRFAALNAWRWEAGAVGFDDLEQYRTYLVNHEFGHGLGYGHVGCPSSGALAPVMMQQSKGLDGCAPNGWPAP